MVVPSGGFRGDESLVLYFKDVEKPSFQPLRVSFHNLYHSCLITEGSDLLKENQVGRIQMTVYSKSITLLINLLVVSMFSL